MLPGQSAAELRVLELGFGTGALLLEAKQRGISIFGLERSAAMHRVAQRRLQEHANPIPCVSGEAEHLPFADTTFDALIATFPAAYIVAPHTLREAARVLRPGGRLIVVGLWVTAVPAWLTRWLPFFYGAPDGNRLTAYQAQISASGFQVTWLTYPDGRFTVGGLVAERRANALPPSI
jgi:ubiquinone/menaquinone biosynthesis C-methylase UbiE